MSIVDPKPEKERPPVEPLPAQGLTVPSVDQMCDDLDNELNQLGHINSSTNRTEWSAMAASHGGEIRKLLIMIREQKLLYDYYRNKMNGSEP